MSLNKLPLFTLKRPWCFCFHSWFPFFSLYSTSFEIQNVLSHEQNIDSVFGVPGCKRVFYGKETAKGLQELSQNINLDHFRFSTVAFLNPTFLWHYISGVIAYLLYMLHLQLHKWQNVYYSCGIGNLQCNIKIRFLSTSQRRSDSFVPHTLFRLQQHWGHLFFVPV